MKEPELHDKLSPLGYPCDGIEQASSKMYAHFIFVHLC